MPSCPLGDQGSIPCSEVFSENNIKFKKWKFCLHYTMD